MEALIGFGRPLVVVLWGISLIVTVWWLGRQLLQRRLVTLLSSAIGFGFFLPITSSSVSTTNCRLRLW